MAYKVTAWRCGGIRCSFCRQLKPIKDKKFNGFYCCLIYNIKLEMPMNSELRRKHQSKQTQVRKHRQLRSDLVKSKWTAKRTDPAMTLYFQEQVKR